MSASWHVRTVLERVEPERLWSILMVIVPNTLILFIVSEANVIRDSRTSAAKNESTDLLAEFIIYLSDVAQISFCHSKQYR